MDYNGARPKEKKYTGLGSDGYREGQTGDDIRLSDGGSTQFVRHLSIRLCDVLNRVGASAELRKLRQECAISREIIMSLDNSLEKKQNETLVSHFIFGSSCEGTTTPGMNSDTDILICENVPVVENISDAGDGHSLLMIRDKHTKPGYVKLQFVYNGQPLTIYIQDIHSDIMESDGEGRLCLKHFSIVEEVGTFHDVRNGPADTSTVANLDAVLSYRCSRIPEFSTEWIVRKRQHKWPSKQMLNKMVKMGCFFVGVGHPASKERNIEWRLSFSLQERELMFGMNSVQHKCYILLKLIKMDMIEPAIGKSISSYHLKTCILYVIENTNVKIWKRANLVQCVLLCLHVLSVWVLKGYCPNYFIKEENMFDRDILRTKRKRIVRHLKHLLTYGFKIPFQIKLDCIGNYLKRVMKAVKIEFTICKAYMQIKHYLASILVKYKARLYWSLSRSQSQLQTLEFLHYIHIYLLHIKYIQDHTEQQTQEAISYIIPFVHTRLAQSYASLALRTDEFRFRNRLLFLGRYHFNKGRHCDMTSARLLDVTILFKLERYEQCIQILDQLEQEFNQFTLLICMCDPRHPVPYKTNHVKECYNLRVASILLKTTTCVQFHCFDLAIIPLAIQYEMHRSVYTPHGSRHYLYDCFMDLAVVDAIIYLQFMKYLVYTNLNQLTHKHVSIQKLEFILKHEQTFGHRETGYNLLGWIYFREDNIRRGIECFRKSWSIREHHNAAKFHVMFYMFGDGTCQT